MKQRQETSSPHLFGQIVVRLIEPFERERFDQLLVEKHYLHSARLGGRHMRYVAELNGEWIALIAFCGAAPYVKARENWIGWSARRRARRLGFVVNNSRFLVLPERGQFPNLACGCWGCVSDGSVPIGSSGGTSRCFWWRASWTKAVTGAPAIGPAALRPWA